MTKAKCLKWSKGRTRCLRRAKTKPRKVGLRGSPTQHAEIAESYLLLHSDTVDRFNEAIRRKKCGRALDWFAETQASIQAIAVSATHAGRKEKAIRRRITPLNDELRKMRGKLKASCMR